MSAEQLRQELVAMKAEDLRVHQELVESGELGPRYVPRMEAVHRANASRLRELIELHGWPTEDIAGTDGAEAAWFITQHAIGEPEFQWHVLELLREAASQGRVPAWQAAYLEDRIAMYEGWPQRYGSQWLDDPRDGLLRPWKLADPQHVDELRAQVGLEPLRPIPEPNLVPSCQFTSGAKSKRAVAGGSDGWKPKVGGGKNERILNRGGPAGSC